MNNDNCPLGGDISNDCDGCIYRGDYKYDSITGDCLRINDNDEVIRSNIDD